MRSPAGDCRQPAPVMSAGEVDVTVVRAAGGSTCIYMVMDILADRCCQTRESIAYPSRRTSLTCLVKQRVGVRGTDLRLAVLLQPGDDAGGESVKGGHADGRIEGLEQLVGDALELQEEGSMSVGGGGGGGLRVAWGQAPTTRNLTWSGTCGASWVG